MPLVTATDLQRWSGTRHAQDHLPTLVRRLILATVAPAHLRFPAAEGVSTPGFDGVVDTPSGALPFVPAGRSVWELGTGASKGGPRAKAEVDYGKRLTRTPAAERAETTFVFVTSRPWSGAGAWAIEKAAGPDGWKGVFAFDAQDVATWLSICPGVHAWLEQEALGRSPYAIEALGDWFSQWADRTEPKIPSRLLLAGRYVEARELVTALTATTAEHLVAAATQEEALAFVAAVLVEGPPAGAERSTSGDGGDAPGEETDDSESDDGASSATRRAFLERSLVVHDAAAWRQWVVHEFPLVLLPVFPDPDVDGALRRGHQVILTRTAGPTDRALPRLRRDRAREAWEEAGLPFPQADELAEAAGRSLTSLRRRIGRAERFRRPAWADGLAANLLAPLLLAGAWRDDVPGDLDLIVELADRSSWRGMARDLRPLAAGEDAPVVQHEHQWEFVDVRDAWAQLCGVLTAEDLDLFQKRVLDVLGEADPAAGLTADERRRLTFSFDGLPRRARSEVLRRAMATTLAVLGSLFEGQVLPGGGTGQDRASRAVRSLLDEADGERWVSLADLLPLLAEASPSAFLDALERSLADPEAAVVALFAEVPDPLGMAPWSRHSALLWALEALAFSPRYLSRVAVALAQLAALDPGGRLANRPAESLTDILHVVLPQSAAENATRMPVVDAIRRAAPAAGWALMLALVRGTDRGMLIRRGPRFREWRPEAPAPTYGDVAEALNGLAERIAADAGDAPDRWRDALSIVDKVPAAAREVLLAAAEAAFPRLAERERKAALTALADRVAQHARFRDAAWALDDETVSRLQAFLGKHAGPDEEPDDHDLFGWRPRRPGLDIRTDEGQAQLTAAREEAVARALRAGIGGVLRLAEAAQLPQAIGETLARLTTNHDEELLPGLSQDGSKAQQLAQGIVRVRQFDRNWLRTAVVEKPQLAVELLLAADLDDDLLDLLDEGDSGVRDLYWQRVMPWQVPEALAEVVAERLLMHDRPFSAMQVLDDSRRDGPVPVELTVRAMTAPAAGTAERADAMHSPQYIIGELLDALERAGATSEELARLEWFYLPLLEHGRAPVALHRRLAADPAFFAEIVCSLYRARGDKEQDEDGTGGAVTHEAHSVDGGEDDEGLKSRVAGAAWRLLHGWRAPLPGSVGGQTPTGDQVRHWVAEAKRLLAAAGRGDIASVVIGEALSGPASDPDGIWPSMPVREVLEAEQDHRLEEGLAIGRFNQRGVMARDPYEGGAQERKLEKQYRGWADAVRETWPRSGAVLDDLADGYAADARREDERAARER